MKYIIDRDSHFISQGYIEDKLDYLEIFEDDLFENLIEQLEKFDEIFNIDFSILTYYNSIKERLQLIKIKEILNQFLKIESSVSQLILDQLEYDILFHFTDVLQKEREHFSQMIIQKIKELTTKSNTEEH